MSLIEQLKKDMPEQHFLFAAVRTLKEKEEIVAFYLEYITLLKRTAVGPHAPENDPKLVADMNICYALGYLGKEEFFR